jgi:hypothetical protein
MNVSHDVGSFVPRISVDHAMIVKKRGRDKWVAHGDPIDIHTRWSHGKVIDARCVGAKVCTDEVIVLFRPCSSEVFVINAQNVKGSLYAYLRNGRYSDDERIECEGSAGK